MPEIAADIAKTIALLRGKAPWGIRLGHGSFITMEFGRLKEKTPPDRIPHGELHLWLYMCNWRMELRDRVVVGSDDSREAIQEALDSNTFDEVQEVQVLSPSLDLVVQFRSGLKILTLSSSRSGKDQWWLFTPEGKCLMVHGGGEYIFENENQSKQ